jgi:hypothetical protein
MDEVGLASVLRKVAGGIDSGSVPDNSFKGIVPAPLNAPGSPRRKRIAIPASIDLTRRQPLAICG